MSWQIEKKLTERLQEESGYYKYPFGTRHAMAICYPNTYEVAMSNLGMQIIYKMVNERPDWLCERAFLPDKELGRLYAKEKTPLLTMALKWIIFIYRKSWSRAGFRYWQLHAAMTTRWS